MKRKSIMIDHDDVLCHGAFLHILNGYLGTNYKEEDFTNYYMQDIIPEEAKEDFFKFYLTKDVYEYAEVMDGAVETLKKLNEEYKIIIGTSFIIPDIKKYSGLLLPSKYNHLFTNFPFINPDNFIFTSDKEDINATIKIDDKISNLKNAKRKLLFTAFHNESISKKELSKKRIERVNDWKEIEEKLLTKRRFF